MADKTVNSGNFSLQIDNLKIEGLRSQAVYNVDPQGVVKGAQVNLTKEITKKEYDKLPDSVRSFELGTAASPSAKYYATLATKNEDERTYTPNKEVLDAIPLAKGATSPSDRDKALFNKEVAEFNNKGKGQFLNVNRNAQITINKEEDFKDNDKRNQTGLGGNAAKPPAEPTPIEKPKEFNAIPGKNVRDSYGSLKYPEKLSDKQDSIQFSMLKYGAKSFRSEDVGGATITTGFGKRVNTSIEGTVTLPIQNQISDTNRVNWGAGDINPIQAFAANQLYNTDITNIAGAFAQAQADGRTALKAGGDDIATFVRTYFIQQAVNTQNLLSRTTGAILNPNVELLFNRPELRPFSFRFYLAARSDTETTQVKKIIRFFKQGMSVKETATDIFLKAPNIFKIKYRYGGGKNSDHPGLNRIKECALISCTVDYTPDNSYMTFEDGTMTAYAIQLQFQELEPITEADYTDSADGRPQIKEDEIGY